MSWHHGEDAVASIGLRPRRGHRSALHPFALRLAAVDEQIDGAVDLRLGDIVVHHRNHLPRVTQLRARDEEVIEVANGIELRPLEERAPLGQTRQELAELGSELVRADPVARDEDFDVVVGLREPARAPSGVEGVAYRRRDASIGRRRRSLGDGLSPRIRSSRRLGIRPRITGTGFGHARVLVVHLGVGTRVRDGCGFRRRARRRDIARLCRGCGGRGGRILVVRQIEIERNDRFSVDFDKLDVSGLEQKT
jgi:hypothetical protein